MARRMIPVRNKETGLTALVSARAFRYFADSHERTDETSDAPPEQASTVQDAPQEPGPQDTAQPTTKSQRRAAAADPKE
ncbi:hypothetical protein [Sphaerisporangium aureirubrum]|uniref:Uncharacterized protein n=1 Tax=Sphaerisporangium aureirubrum TaxID=1544736 RepID=A0ABW1NEG2_9ACTN